MGLIAALAWPSCQLKATDLVTFSWQDQGVGLLEDGLYTTAAEIRDPKKLATLAKFVKASIEGWTHAAAHQGEAVDIIMKNDTTGAQTKGHQGTTIEAVAPLLEGVTATGYLEPADDKRTVDILMQDKILAKEPSGAWTHRVYDAAMK